MSGISVVQNVAPTPSSGTTTASATIAGVTAGDAIIAIIGYAGNNVGVPASVNDGNAYTKDFSAPAVSRPVSVSFWSLFDAGGGSHTVEATKASGDTTADVCWAIVLLELSGVPTTNSFDIAAGTSTAGTGPLSQALGSLANAGDIVLFGAVVNAVITGMSTPSGWTSLSLFDSQFPSSAASYLLPGSTAPLTPSYGTISSGNNYSTAMAAYQPAGGGSPLTVQDDAQWFQFIQNPNIRQLPERVRRPRWRASRSGLYVPEHLKAA